MAKSTLLILSVLATCMLHASEGRSPVVDKRWRRPARYCPSNYRPVCGTNGVTYSNSCWARRAWVSGCVACNMKGCIGLASRPVYVEQLP